MTTIKVASSSITPIRVPVYIKSSSAPVNPSTFPVKFAFVAENANDPADNVYSAGSWELDKGIWYALFSVQGLAEGRYDIWVWVNAGAAAAPRAPVGTLVVT
jgi:hypothetical protein